MDASVKGDNIRTFVRLLQCASRYGDDLNIHANAKVWEMSVTNSSKSAFCLFKLDKSFFCRWEPKARKGVKCRLLVKSVLAVLGRASQITTVDRLDLRIIDPSNDLRPPQHRREGTARRTRDTSLSNTEDGETRRYGDEDDWEEDDDARVGIEAKLVMRLVCKHGVTKKHSLHLGSSDFLRADVDPDTTPSGFVIATRTLRDWLDHFSLVSGGGYGANRENSSSGTNQLGWMFSKNQVRVKSWEAMGGSGLSTEIKVEADEFQEYEITEDRIDLTLPMREFKATLVLAEQLSATLNISFSEPGQPLTLTSLESEFEDFSIFCAIATTVCEVFADVRVGGPEVKRSSSDRSRTNTPTSLKRRGSDMPSQFRKRSTLSMSTAAEEPEQMVNVFIAGKSSSRSAVDGRVPESQFSGGGADETDVALRPDGTEALFLPGASQRELSPDDGEEGPPRSQVVRMSQAEVLSQAGFGDMDFDQLAQDLDNAADEYAAEERAASQAFPRDPGATGGVSDDQQEPAAPAPQETNQTQHGTSSAAMQSTPQADSSGTRATSHPSKVANSVSDVSHDKTSDLIWNQDIDLTGIPGGGFEMTEQRISEDAEEMDDIEHEYHATQNPAGSLHFKTFFSD